MWTLNLRIGPAEFILLASVLVAAALAGVAFTQDWLYALVPAMTYVLASAAGYGLWRRLQSEQQAIADTGATVRFRVVGGRGVCPLGHREGDLVAVSPRGAATPMVCPEAQAVLRLAAANGGGQQVKEWCCPVYEHMLVFRRERVAA
ncbi:MAG: hypothetical protein Q7T33_06990 [Dehalococcoidia bacterium]|nr:hypothetical protein [Dehalococcoidia bacterium]